MELLLKCYLRRLPHGSCEVGRDLERCLRVTFDSLSFGAPDARAKQGSRI